MDSANKESKLNEEFVKNIIFFKINKWGVLTRPEVLDKNRKINKGVCPFGTCEYINMHLFI